MTIRRCASSSQPKKLPRSSGVCAASGRVLASGESYWTSITIENGSFVRREYADDAWNERLKEQAFSFWRAAVPLPDQPTRPRLADNEVILEFFKRLENREEQEELNFRYVLGLLLTRKKIFTLTDIVREAQTLAIRRFSKLTRTREQLEAVIELARLRSVTPDEPACWLAFVATRTCLPAAERLDALACLMDYLQPDSEEEKDEELRQIVALLAQHNDRPHD